MNKGNDMVQVSRPKGIMTVVLGSSVFVLIVVLVNWTVKGLFGEVMASSLRARATIELTGAMVSEIIVLILLVLYLRHGAGRLGRCLTV